MGKYIKSYESLRFKNVKMVSVGDWDRLVQNTYGCPYSFQQQDGCKGRGIYNFTVLSKWADDEDVEMHDDIPEVVNGNIMGVKFSKWLERDPSQPVAGRADNINIWWERNFYPAFDMVVNDLYKNGLLEAGDYSINIDW